MNALSLANKNSNSYVAIHDRAMLAAANYKRSEIALLEAIIEVESRQVYFQLEITSLFQYCVEILNLSRHAAYDFITVMRKSVEVPAMLEAIRVGKTTVSKARKVCSVIKVSNAKEWLELAEHCSTRIVEKAVAMANPRAAVVESAKYVSADTLELKFAVSEEWIELLDDVKDLMSQKSMRAVSTEEALFTLMSEYKRKRDPVLRAKRVNDRNAKRAVGQTIQPVEDSQPAESKVTPLTEQMQVGEPSPLSEVQSKTRNEVESNSSANQLRRYIPAATRNKLALRDEGKCSFTDRHGKRCGSKRWVQIHHVEHFAAGGSHSIDNLQTLCWAHHAIMHRN